MAKMKRHHHQYMGRHQSSRPDTEMYAGKDERRMQEHRDAGMIHEDHNAIANLPQGVVMREYPKSHDYLDWSSDDTAGGIHAQMDLDHGKMRKTFNPKKF